jgi:hypothetical protein
MSQDPNQPQPPADQPPQPPQQPQQPSPPPPGPPPPAPGAPPGQPPAAPGGAPPPPMGVPPATKRTNGKAVASLVCGIAGFLVCPLVLHIAAIILGNQAKGEISRDPSQEGQGMAQAGYILGVIGLVLSVLTVVLIIVIAVASSA